MSRLIKPKAKTLRAAKGFVKVEPCYLEGASTVYKVGKINYARILSGPLKGREVLLVSKESYWEWNKEYFIKEVDIVAVEDKG